MDVDEDDDDLLIVALAIQFMIEEVDEMKEEIDSLLLAHVREQRRLNRNLPRHKDRITWTAFKQKVTPDHFRKMFRMPVAAFEKLCSKTSNKYGEKCFCPEKYLLEKHPNNSRFVAGEIKVAVCIRMLAGGSHLDLVPLFDVCKSETHVLIRQFLDWVLGIFSFPLVGWLRERRWAVLEHLANQFAEKSNGIFYGPFASLDGLAIRIRSPKPSDGVFDPGIITIVEKDFMHSMYKQYVIRKRDFFGAFHPTRDPLMILLHLAVPD